jgi:tryptophan synthase alpha chain
LTSRIEQVLVSARKEGRVELVPYFAAGYPDLAATGELIRAAAQGGAGAVELGVPFSDPMADGVSIQRATFKALQNGVTPNVVLETVAELRQAGVVIPIIVMTYYNPILAFGQDAFVRQAANVGVDGVIPVDLPPDEAGEFAGQCRAEKLDFIPILAPTSTDERVTLASKEASGFVYCVSVAGVTGAREALPEGLEGFLERVRRQVTLPLGVGFGISRREHVERLVGKAEAAIVGSAFVDVIERSPREKIGEKVTQYVEVLTGRTEARI